MKPIGVPERPGHHESLKVLGAESPGDGRSGVRHLIVAYVVRSLGVAGARFGDRMFDRGTIVAADPMEPVTQGSAR